MLRTAIVILNVLAGSGLFIAFVSSGGYRTGGWLALLFTGVCVLLITNAVMIFSSPHPAQPRIGRLVSLWLSAKEKELEQRAGRG